VIEILQRLCFIFVSDLIGRDEVMDPQVDVDEPIDIDEEVEGEVGPIGDQIVVKEISQMEGDGDGIVDQGKEPEDIPTDAEHGVRVLEG
jgi:hypothetical protein